MSGPFGSSQWAYASGADAFTLDQSLKFEEGRTPYLSRTFGTPTSTQKFSFSCWIKRSDVTTV